MNFTLKMECPGCGCSDMSGAGGSVGGRISYAKRRCDSCGLVVMILPMMNGFEYGVSAKSETDIEADIEKRRRLSDLKKDVSEKLDEINTLTRSLM